MRAPTYTSVGRFLGAPNAVSVDAPVGVPDLHFTPGALKQWRFLVDVDHWLLSFVAFRATFHVGIG